MANSDNKLVIQRFVEEVLNRRNFAVLDELVVEDFVEEEPFTGQGSGRAGLRDVLQMFVDAFPDMHWTIEEQIAEGSKVVTRFTFTGTHKGDFLGVTAKGKHVQTWGVVIDMIQNGKMTRSRIIMDVAGMVGQMPG